MQQRAQGAIAKSKKNITLKQKPKSNKTQLRRQKTTNTANTQRRETNQATTAQARHEESSTITNSDSPQAGEMDVMRLVDSGHPNKLAAMTYLRDNYFYYKHIHLLLFGLTNDKPILTKDMSEDEQDGLVHAYKTRSVAILPDDNNKEQTNDKKNV